MIKTLAIKELRESAAIIGVAALAMLWQLGYAMNWGAPFMRNDSVIWDIPFITNIFGTSLIFIGSLFSIAMGLKQTAGEDIGSRWYFLLHRPVTRQQLLFIKMGIGLALVLLFSIGPLLIYANWAATPGNHATPFFWGMTRCAWQVCCAFPSIYLGAVLSGMRPARWFGTRLFPLAGVCLAALALTAIWHEGESLWGLVGLVVLDFILWRLILSTAEQRDY